MCVCVYVRARVCFGARARVCVCVCVLVHVCAFVLRHRRVRVLLTDVLAGTQYSGNATRGDNPHMDCKTREVISDTFLARTHAHLHKRTRMRVHARASPLENPSLSKRACPGGRFGQGCLRFLTLSNQNKATH